MKKIITTIVGFGAFAVQVMFSSCNFLDVDHFFKATFKEDSIFHSKENAHKYLWNVAAQFPHVDAIWKNSWFPGQLASDELATKQRYGSFWGVDFAAGRINEHSLKNWDTWRTCYLIIQRCNKMLANVNGVEDMVDSDRREYRAYAHFLRGWAYYHILMNWGPLLIVGDEISPTNVPDSHYDRERSTFDESVDYICNEFALSLKALPKPNEVSLQYFERPNAGIALALIARLRLLQASPTFNGGESARRAFNGWKNSKGEDYINQTYDPSRWAVAAAAAKQVIDLNYYQLYTEPLETGTFDYLDETVSKEAFPNGVGGIDPYASFANMFNGEALTKTNKEMIWAKVNAGYVNDAARHSFPTGGNFGGFTPICVPQRVVDCFLMKDGKLPKDSPLYVQDIKEVTEQAETISTYELKNGVSKQYANRSVRFYASIGFPGRFWPMNTCQKPAGKNQQIWYDNSDKNGGKSGVQNHENLNITGYVPVKFVHPDDSWYTEQGSGVSRVPKSFPIIRYAEMLLIYCEAMNQVADATVVKVWDRNGEEQEVSLSRDTEEMRKYFNMIRYRVGLPGVEDAVLTDVEAFDKLIRNERQVEFFNEGHRYWDTRRWGTYITEDAEDSNWQGLEVQKDKEEGGQNSGFWTIVKIAEQNYRDRVAHPKMIFLPIHHDELLKTPKMDQNWGWER